MKSGERVSLSFSFLNQKVVKVKKEEPGTHREIEKKRESRKGERSFFFREISLIRNPKFKEGKRNRFQKLYFSRGNKGKKRKERRDLERSHSVFSQIAPFLLHPNLLFLSPFPCSLAGERTSRTFPLFFVKG